MSCFRYLVRSFILAAVLNPLVQAGPFKPDEGSSITAEVLISSTSSTIQSSTDTEEADYTTTSIKTVTLQLTKPTSTVKPVCVDNRWDPPPWDALCGVEGRTQTIEGHVRGRGDKESEIECRKTCQQKRGCILFSFLKDERCDFWDRFKVLTNEKFNGHKWWEPRCFCNVPDYEPLPED